MNQPESNDRRLDGWKAIAAYFRRDRTTVMRWARERSLPVHRLPGGKQGSVFAYEHELKAWAGQLEQSDLAEDLPALPDDAPPSPASPAGEPIRFPPAVPEAPGKRTRPLFVALGAVFVIAALLTITVTLSDGLGPAQSPVERAAALPSDPAIADDYVAARDLWARRTPADLRRAITLYEKVITADPDFAPAYAGLAEAWLIYREYGAATESRAYSAAKSAVEQALSLDGQLAAAHRANGFIQYWWSYDAQRSVDSFRRALELDPRDGLTHFWYANVLSDLGQDAAAQRAYDTAQLLLPGTPAIAVERACAHWQAGRDRRAVMELNQLKAQYPDDATIRNCLAWAHISRGDIKAYAREYRALASLRAVPEMQRLSRALDAAIARDPATAHKVLVADARREFAEGERKTRMTPAFHASCMGDRETLVALLQQASMLGERWYSATLNRRIARKWRSDAEIIRLLNKVMVATPDVDLS
ncbi:tetratricopeptide repeat protein [Sphingomonas sp. 35-24ZXX]|uniref:tetratricopeptide repeat protein n=1 Tax=Sphingomonas sp. 35-24ZXX TaxID=1545915 RepID=UPI00053BFF10|nr:tetratricopeptide repeat protein [Sphingomonas sp. 35-24ZXX]